MPRRAAPSAARALLPRPVRFLSCGQHAARAVEVEAYAQVAEARRRAAAALKAIGSYPHQIDRTLRAADEARPHAPDSDPLPPTAEYWLKEIAKELDAARVRLDGLHPGPEREAALVEARLSLERHDIDRDYAWATQLHRTLGGWKVMENARIAAKNLRAAHPDLFRKPAAPALGASPVIPHRDRVEHPYGDEGLSEPGMAAATRRGLGNRTNQDAATLVTLPNGDRVALVVDGVFSYPDSRLAAVTFATAFRAELGRTDQAGRTAVQALRDAHQAGLDALTMRYTPETGHGAVAYVAAYYGADGSITISHVGTGRAYYLPLDRSLPGEQLTVDDSRGGDITDGGIMTRWAASDYRPEPTITTPPRPGVPGVLVLVTDGLWRYLPEAEDMAKALADTPLTDSTEVANRLADAARHAEGRDDLTVAVMQPAIRGLGAAPPRGLGGSGGGGRGPAPAAGRVAASGAPFSAPSSRPPSSGVPAVVAPSGLLASLLPSGLSQHERNRWANRLEAVLAEVPDGFDRPALLTDIWLIDAARLLRGDWDPAWPRPPPLVVHQGIRNGHFWVGDTLHLVATGPVELAAVLVEAMFADWWGFNPAQARVVAALVERAVSHAGPTVSVEVPADERTRHRIAELLADRSDWRTLALAWANEPAVAAAAHTGPSSLGGRAATGPAAQLVGIAAPRPNLRPENYPVEARLADRYGVVRAPLDSAAAVDVVRVQRQVKGVLALDGTIWIIPATLPVRSGKAPEFSHAVAAAGHDVQLAFTAWLAVTEGRVVVERITARSGHYNDGNTDTQNRQIVAALHRAFAIYGIDAAPGAPGGGGPVALEALSEADRLAVLDALPGLGSRMSPLHELPHRMPRGPPGVEVLVLDGELPVAGVIAFGWADRGAVVITRRMLDEIAAHLAAGRLDAGWWYGLLVHERDFHLPGDGRRPEHTGHRHDAHAAPLADALRAARGGRLPSARVPGRFVFSWKAIGAGTVGWAVLEVLVSNVPGLRGVLPEPFDLFAHAKNLKGGALVAVLALMLRQRLELRSTGTTYLTHAQVRSFFRRWIPGVLVAATLLNAMTETAWGLSLVGHRFFPVTTPDALDLVYSVGFAGALAAVGWRRDTAPARRGGDERELAKDALDALIGPARADLDAVVEGMGLSFAERRAARRDLKRGLTHYWGRTGMNQGNVHVPVHLQPLARALAERAERAGVWLCEVESFELATRLLYWSTATAPYAARHTESVRRPAVDIGAPVRDAVTAAFAALLPEPLRDALKLDRHHLHQVREHLRDRGGPVALGGMGSAVGGEVVARLPGALRGARPLSGEEFPNLARGPPEGVVLVRITEDDLGDGGSLIAFGWRDATHAPDGVIVVPARVARFVETLIAADAAFADWWARLLRHELDFHIDGDEHTGHRHDTHAAALAAEYDVHWRGGGARDDVALRRTQVGEWDPAFLRDLAAGSPEDALLAVLDAQGMSGTPTLADAADWSELLAAGHQPGPPGAARPGP